MYDGAGARRPRAKSRLGITATATIGAIMTTAGAAAPAEAAAPRASGLDRVERRVVSLVNSNRSTHGLGLVRASRRLARAADFHSADMARRGFFAHDSSSGAGFATRVRRFASAAAFGENLAYVSRGIRGGVAERVVALWMGSPSHRATMLSPAYHRIGVARRPGTLGSVRATVFTADFASAR